MFFKRFYRLTIHAVFWLLGAFISLGYQSVAWAIVDTMPPQLLDFQLIPPSIDVSSGPQVVTASFLISDDLSGTDEVEIRMLSPSGSQFQFNESLTPTIVDISGDRYDVNLTFAQFAENGDWSVISVQMADMVGNRIDLDTAALAAMGFPVLLTVISDPVDTFAPEVIDIQFSADVDVSSSDQDVTLSLTLFDDLSGVIFQPAGMGEFFPFFAAQMVSPSGNQKRFISSLDFMFDPADLTWDGVIHMPQSSEPGTWSIEFLELRDVAGNSIILDGATLSSRGLDVDFGVTSVPSDTTAPVLRGISFLPTLVDTSSGDQTVTVDLQLTDDLAGVSFDPTTPQLSFFEAGIRYRSPSGLQEQQAAFFNSFSLQPGGTPQNGTWRGEVHIPQFSEAGTWFIDLLELKDRTRNRVTFDRPALEAMGYSTTLTVVRPSLVTDGIADSAGATICDDTFGCRAQVIIPTGVLSAPTEVAIDVFESPLDIALPSGYEAAGTYFVNIAFTPVPAFPLPAPGLTLRLPLPNPLPVGTSLALMHYEGGLVLLGVTGTVDPGGLSATFTGVLSLSTLVGLIPESEVVSVVVDVKPGSLPNTVNCGAQNSVIPVAVLSDASFDASRIDANSVLFGKTGAEAAETHRDRNDDAQRHVKDLNEDGLLDMVFDFRLGETGFDCSDVIAEATTEVDAILTGETMDGVGFEGQDSIRLLNP